MPNRYKNTRELLEHWPGLREEDRAALLSVIATRGKYKGFVLSSPPSMTKDPLRYAAWQAVISELAPMRVSIGSLILNLNGVREHFDRLDALLRRGLGYAINVYEPPYRWNTYAHTVDDIEELRAAVHYYCANQGVA